MEAALRAQALVLAKRQALATAEDIFERTTCAICHQVDRKEVEGGELTWEVLPVKLVDRWMPKSVFDHQPHKDQSCATCHNAKASAFANDVLMPDLANCKTCHGGPESDNKIQSECIDCHQFHHPQQGLMGADLDQFTLSLGP
jgi:DnaJ-class molecular chaperone